jgi:hypothetical protein
MNDVQRREQKKTGKTVDESSMLGGEQVLTELRVSFIQRNRNGTTYLDFYFSL